MHRGIDCAHPGPRSCRRSKSYRRSVRGHPPDRVLIRGDPPFTYPQHEWLRLGTSQLNLLRPGHREYGRLRGVRPGRRSHRLTVPLRHGSHCPYRRIRGGGSGTRRLGSFHHPCPEFRLGTGQRDQRHAEETRRLIRPAATPSRPRRRRPHRPDCRPDRDPRPGHSRSGLLAVTACAPGGLTAPRVRRPGGH